MKRRLLLTACFPALLLAACSDGAGEGEADSRKASGEVLEGTISDAMIPLDTLTSQPPLVKEAPKASSDSADDEGEAADETPGDAPLMADEPAAGAAPEGGN